MSPILPIPYRRKRTTLGAISKIELDSEAIIKFDKHIEPKYSRVKNFRHKNIELNETNHQHLLNFITGFKHKHYKRATDLNVILSFIWTDRIKIFLALAHSIKQMGLLKKFSINIDFCLDLHAVEFLLHQMRHLKHLIKVKIDLSKFYRMQPSFIRNLGNLVSSFSQLQCAEIALRKTPEMSFSDELSYLFRSFSRLSHIKRLAFCYAESFQMKKYYQSQIPSKIYDYLSKLHLSSLSFSIKSNGLFDQSLLALIKALSSNKNLTKLYLQLMDVENLFDAHLTYQVLEALGNNKSIASLDFNNTLQGVSQQNIETLYTSALKFLTFHSNLEAFGVRLTAPSYFKGMKLASSYASLKRLKILDIAITNSSDLILLQEIGKLGWLKELKVILEFELDTQISGFLESLRNLCQLKTFVLESKKKVPGMFFQKEDFRLLFTSLTQMKDLKQMTLFIPIQENSPANLTSQELNLLIEFLKNTSSLEMCLVRGKWGFISRDDLFLLFEVFFKKLQIAGYFEFYLGLRESSKINFAKMFKDLQTKYKKSLYDRQKQGPKFELIVHTN